MTDPFSVGAGVVGVLSLAIEVTKITRKYSLEWKEAPDKVKEFLCEVHDLKDFLEDVKEKCGCDEDFRAALEGQRSAPPSSEQPHVTKSGEKSDPTESCRVQLATLIKDLEKRAKGHRFGWERLKAPFLAEDLQASVEQMYRHCRRVADKIGLLTSSIAAMALQEVRQSRDEHREWHNAAENQRILKWLSQLSFEERHRDILAKRFEGTGEWFLNRDDFKAWRNGSLDVSATMWCDGIPGAGKSVMTSIVIENLQKVFPENDVSIAYAYCDYKARESQTTDKLLSSLVKQLALQLKDMPLNVQNLYKKRQNGETSLTRAEYLELLWSLAGRSRRCFVIVDALDENLVHGDEDQLLEANILDELQTLQLRDPKCRAFSMFLTSRLNDTIKQQLSGSLHHELRAANDDVELYVRSRIANKTFRFVEAVNKNPRLGDNIVTTVVEKAQGMFLLPRLHLDRLACQTSVRGLRNALNCLPIKLDKTYDDAIHRIRSQVEEHRELAMRALGWICNAVRSLNTQELLHALAVAPGDHDLDPEALVDSDVVISVSAGLLTVDKESNVFRLVHYTVGEYLDRRQFDLFPNIDDTITETCLAYLLFDIFESDICFVEAQLNSRMQDYPLVDYAAAYWGPHAQKGFSLSVNTLAIELLQNQRKVLSCFQILLDNTCGNGITTGMHITAHLGLEKLLLDLLERGMAADAWDYLHRTPLHLAASRGHLAIIQILLCRDDVNPNSGSEHGSTSLHLAVLEGKNLVVEFLADRDDVHTDCKDVCGMTPLMCAASGGHVELVKLLADREDVDVNSEDVYGRTALLLTLEEVRIDVTNLLLTYQHIKVDKRDYKGRSALTYSVDCESASTTKRLLDLAGIEALSKDYIGRTPLSYAAQIGSSKIIQLLLDCGNTTADDQDNQGRTPLSYAAERGDPKFPRLFLDRGNTTADSQDKQGRTPLSHAAAAYDNSETVKLLLNHEDTTANSKDNRGRTPLSYAAERSSLPTFELLMNCKDADIWATDEQGRSPVIYAALEGRASIVEMLLHRNILKVNSRYMNGETLLCWATYKGHESVIELLLACDEVKVNDTDDKGRTPLMCAAFRGYTWTVELLLARNDVQADIKDDLGRTALSYAAEYGWARSVKLLLARDDVDPDCRDDKGRTPLSYAADRGYIYVVNILLVRDDIEADSRDKQGRTPLSYAVQRRYTSVIDLLTNLHDVNPLCEDIDGRTPEDWAGEDNSDGDEYESDWYPPLDDKEDNLDDEEEYSPDDDDDEEHSLDEHEDNDKDDCSKQDNKSLTENDNIP